MKLVLDYEEAEGHKQNSKIHTLLFMVFFLIVGAFIMYTKILWVMPVLLLAMIGLFICDNDVEHWRLVSREIQIKALKKTERRRKRRKR